MCTLIDLTSQRFGRLTVIRRIGSNSNGGARWECLCDCGKIVVVAAGHLRKKNKSTKSCGCLNVEAQFAKKGISLVNHPWYEGGQKNVGSIAWAKAIIRKSTANSLRDNYRPPIITPEELVEMVNSHNGACDICGEFRGIGGRGGLHLDHDHKTGKVRGYACPPCNIKLGFIEQYRNDLNFKTNIDRYLENYEVLEFKK